MMIWVRFLYVVEVQFKRIVNDGVAAIAGTVGSSVVIRPSHHAIGTGSTTVLATDTALNAETDRNPLSSVDLSVSQNITFISDFSSTEISGTSVAEFGLFNAASAGSLFHRESIETIAFSGDRELQIQSTIRFSRSGA